MLEKKLKITYQGEVSEEFDEEVKKFLKKQGWKFEGSGWNFEKQERDLAFYKPIK